MCNQSEFTTGRLQLSYKQRLKQITVALLAHMRGHKRTKILGFLVLAVVCSGFHGFMNLHKALSILLNGEKKKCSFFFLVISCESSPPRSSSVYQCAFMQLAEPRGEVEKHTDPLHCCSEGRSHVHCSPSPLQGKKDELRTGWFFPAWEGNRHCKAAPTSKRFGEARLWRTRRSHHHGRHVPGPQGERVPLDVMQEVRAVLPQAVDEFGGQRGGELQELIGVKERSHGGVQAERKQLDPSRSTIVIEHNAEL